jgi:hypothetical protein
VSVKDHLAKGNKIIYFIIRRERGIGIWLPILELFSFLGIFTNILLFSWGSLQVTMFFPQWFSGEELQVIHFNKVSNLFLPDAVINGTLPATSTFTNSSSLYLQPLLDNHK